MNSSRPGNASPVACQRDERGRRYPPSPPGPAGLPVDRRARPSPLQRRDAWTARSPVHAGRQAYLAACKCPRGSRQHPIPARQHDAIAGPGTRAPLVVTARRCTSKAGRRTIKARIFGRRSVGRDAPGGRRRRRDRAGRRRRSRSVTQVSSVVSALAANTRKFHNNRQDACALEQRTRCVTSACCGDRARCRRSVSRPCVRWCLVMTCGVE